MVSFCAGASFGLLFENKLIFLLSYSLSVQSRAVQVATALTVFLTFPPQSGTSGIRTECSSHALTHDPITNCFRPQRQRLSTDSFQGTYHRFPAETLHVPGSGAEIVLRPHSKWAPRIPIRGWSCGDHKIPNTRWGGREPLPEGSWHPERHSFSKRGFQTQPRVQPNSRPQTF